MELRPPNKKYHLLVFVFADQLVILKVQLRRSYLLFQTLLCACQDTHKAFQGFQELLLDLSRFLETLELTPAVACGPESWDEDV